MSIQAIDHPEYDEERAHLKTIITTLDNELQKSIPNIAFGGNKYTHRQLLEINAKRIEKLKLALTGPYVGRVDIREEGETETLYVGRITFPNLRIYHWADTMAAKLYNMSRAIRPSMTLLLKRTFELDVGAQGYGDQLQAIRDEYIDSSLLDQLGQLDSRFVDSLLLKILREHRRGQLRDIVATIQEQQYRLISTPRETTLIVQGAPGSGKTAIALHRVAYLLYHHQDLKPSQVLVLGPNRTFLSYISAILPSLGERNIPHRTFDEWMLEHLGTNVPYESQDESLEALLSPSTPSAVKVMQYRNATFKSSLAMAQLLDAYVALLRAERDSLLRTKALECTIRVPLAQHREVGVERDLAQIQAAIAAVADRPLNAQREAFQELLSAELIREFRRFLERELRNELITEATITNEVRRQVQAYFKDLPPAQNAAVAYRRLLRTPGLLRQAGAGLLDEVQIELLTQDAPTARTPFRFDDLAALLYLRLRLEGPGERRYDHIVIDEAQDISPLLAHALTFFCRERSLTILGDLAQSIYHTTSDWTPLTAALQVTAPIQESVQTSYRSTDEIIARGNTLLGRLGAETDQLALPIGRPGSEPTVVACADDRALARHIADLVATERAAGRTSIAVLCKTLTGCRALEPLLHVAGLSDIQRVDRRDVSYSGGLALFPSYLTKGLEFDSVIVADASASHYQADTLDGRLLYVAITRASHTLHLCWVGACSPLLGNDPSPISLRAPLEDVLTAPPITLAAYVQQDPRRSLDAVVELLATREKLQLLRNGTINRTVLELILATGASPREEADDEQLAQPLDAPVVVMLREYIATVERDPAAHDALTASKLACGLLRHQIRAVGLSFPDERILDTADHLALVLALRRAIRHGGVTPTAGRWTTPQRALQAVPPAGQPTAERVLAALLTAGILEQGGGAARRQIRVPTERVVEILDLALGMTPSWEPELVEQLPRFPETVRWSATVEHLS